MSSSYKATPLISPDFRVSVMVFNATLNNISAISWRPVLLVEQIEVPGENHRPDSSHWQTLSHMFIRVHLAWVRFGLTKLVVMDLWLPMQSVPNYNTITTTMAPARFQTNWDRNIFYIVILKRGYPIHKTTFLLQKGATFYKWRLLYTNFNRHKFSTNELFFL